MDGGAADDTDASVVLRGSPTCEAQWELERREGVQAYLLGPDAAVEITVDGERRSVGRGPMTVTVNRDERPYLSRMWSARKVPLDRAAMNAWYTLCGTP